MAHYDIFREQLVVKYPAYGHALWEPNPGRLYSPLEVGDVGYVREGKFHRLFFNALQYFRLTILRGSPEVTIHWRCVSGSAEASCHHCWCPTCGYKG
ncbi:hypothetical protein BC826DRAFT_1006275 [Russula brevipes]|nr:hypothetical protein BC826DRAFT_1006275 [Russula brevipes]